MHLKFSRYLCPDNVYLKVEGEAGCFSFHWSPTEIAECWFAQLWSSHHPPRSVVLKTPLWILTKRRLSFEVNSLFLTNPFEWIFSSSDSHRKSAYFKLLIITFILSSSFTTFYSTRWCIEYSPDVRGKWKGIWRFVMAAYSVAWWNEITCDSFDNFLAFSSDTGWGLN